MSYFHYSKWHPGTAEQDGANLHLDGERPGTRTLGSMRYRVRLRLFDIACWARLGALVVRFEEPARQPGRRTQAHQRLDPSAAGVTNPECRAVLSTRPIGPRPAWWTDDTCARAGVAGWKTELPDEIASTHVGHGAVLDGMRAHEYCWERAAPEPAAFDYSAIDPFRAATTFDNGEPVGTYLPILYFHYVDGATARWPNPCRLRRKLLELADVVG